MIKFYFSKDFRGEGISKDLERGFLVDYNGKNLVQEGMGLGAPAIKTNNGTYFSSNSRILKISEREYIKEFYINSELIWEIFKSDSERFNDFNLLTIFINKLTDLYKRMPFIQRKLLSMGILVRNLFQTKSKIKRIRPIGKILFKYNINNSSLLIEVDFSNIIRNNRNKITKICLLNELGGDYFDSCKKGDQILNPPSGWVKIDEDNKTKLYSKKYKLDFQVAILHKSPDFNLDFIIGRENLSNFCWAGFDIEIDIKSLQYQKNEYKINYVCKLLEK